MLFFYSINSKRIFLSGFVEFSNNENQLQKKTDASEEEKIKSQKSKK